MARDTYNRAADVLRVVDGDTLWVRADLGFYTDARFMVRIRGMQAPELRGPNKVAGKLSADYLSTLVGGKRVTIESYGQDKYGRWVCEVWVDGANVALNMIANKYAVEQPL